jgi:asparagine synthase (glutamine-hydrolysing)
VSGLCGWFSTRAAGDGEAAVQRMLARRPAGGEPAVWTSERAACAAFGSAERASLHRADGFALALRGRPRLHDNPPRTHDATRVVDALRSRGADALGDLRGPFALAAWDERSGRGWLAVDRVGVERLVWTRVDGTVVFASSIDLVGGHPAVALRLAPQGLFDYLWFHVSPAPGSVFEDVRVLLPGQCLEFDDRGVREPRAYWSLRFDEHPQRDFAASKAEFVALLERAVADASDDGAVGAFLSGGTDSSTVTGMLARVGARPARAFSIGFDVDGYDEMAYADIAAAQYGCEHHAYYVTPHDVVEALPSIAAFYDEPFGNASAVPTYYCAKLAREHGVTRLLAGDGGDELFGGNERYGKQQLLAWYHRLPAALRRGLEPLLLATPASGGLLPLRKLRSFVEQARPPMPDRYASRNLLEHLGLAQVFSSDFLAAVAPGHPHGLLVDAHAPHAEASLVNQMLAVDLRFILADGDLRKVIGMCSLAGVGVAFPLLDERLIDFAGTLPASYKLRGTQLRWFFKKALEDFLPPAVIAKKKHGFGLPVGAWLVGHRPLFELAADSIGGLRRRGIVQPAFVDDLLGRRLAEHPAYYGTMVWVLMMLGLWLESRRL